MVDPAEQDALADVETSEEAPEAGEPVAPNAPNAPSLAPSSLGLTCRVDGSVDTLTVRASWARYDRVPAGDGAGLVWSRVPLSGVVPLPLVEGALGPVRVHEDQPQAVVRGRARRYQGDWLVSLFLVNAQPRPPTRSASAWLFQVELALGGPDGMGGPAAVFLPRPESGGGGDPSDRAAERRLAMGYRYRPEFAVGHATGVAAEQAPGNPLRAMTVRTATVPSHEVPATAVPNADDDPDLPELASLVTDMRRLGELADGAPERLAAALAPLVDGYRAWVARHEAMVDDPASHLGPYRLDAADALGKAREAADRIQAGIDRLASDPVARAVFGFANRAMHLQRIHTRAAAERHGDTSRPLDDVLAEVDVPANRSWRPFQLAFILLCLPALADPEHPERADDRRTAVADLLWFPTGGGKTEAYLGLTAFTLAVRRLQPPSGGLDPTAGVAVLMRYTLRLLTIQQFQRATALICACETLRQAEPGRWGGTPFRIGLWVGGRVTPNRTDSAQDWLAQGRRGTGARVRGTGSPHQLTSCPWCGTAVDAGQDITVDPVARRTRITCPDLDCAFGAVAGDGEGLPVVVVDEEIYRLLPSIPPG